MKQAKETGCTNERTIYLSSIHLPHKTNGQLSEGCTLFYDLTIACVNVVLNPKMPLFTKLHVNERNSFLDCMQILFIRI